MVLKNVVAILRISKLTSRKFTIIAIVKNHTIACNYLKSVFKLGKSLRDNCNMPLVAFEYGIYKFTFVQKRTTHIYWSKINIGAAKDTIIVAKDNAKLVFPYVFVIIFIQSYMLRKVR